MTPKTPKPEGQFPVVQQETTTTPTTNCTSIPPAPSVSGNAAGSTQGGYGRATAPTGRSQKVRFGEACYPSTCMTELEGANSAPTQPSLRGAGFSRDNAAGAMLTPRDGRGRVTALTGSREVSAGHHQVEKGQLGDGHATEGVGEHNFVSNWLYNKTDRLLVFLYDDANGIRQTALRDAHIRTHNVPLKYNNSTEQLRRQILELTSQKPDLLWVRLVGCKTPRGDRYDQRQSKALHQLLLTQLDQQRHILVEGSLKDSGWDLPGFTSLREDSRVYCTRHRWCQYGIRDTEGMPSQRCTTLVSSFPLRDRSTCKCERHASLLTKTSLMHDIVMLAGFVGTLVRNLLASLGALPHDPKNHKGEDLGDAPEFK